MKKLVKEWEYFLAWLVFWLCNAVAGFFLGTAAGGVVRLLLQAVGVRTNAIKTISGNVGLVLSIVLSYVLFRIFVGNMIVRKAGAKVHNLIHQASNQSSGGDRR
jgi:hypothetical protein